MPRRILMTTWGSLGDLHPYIAVGIGLRQRGHEVTIATSEVYRKKIEGEGLGFAPVRPDLGQLLLDRDVVKRALDRKTGTEYLVRQLILPFLAEAYEDLAAAAKDKDLLISHPVAYALPIVAEKLGLPWISIVLSPLALFSTSDPPVFAPAPYLYRLRRLGRWPYTVLYSLFKAQSRAWTTPIHELRRRLGLPRLRAHPLVEANFSPRGVLCWFSRVLAEPQPDWPPRSESTGFAFYDRSESDEQGNPALERFLSDGEPPIVFTLGSGAVWQAGNFYGQSLAAAIRLGRRAVLVVGADPQNQLSGTLPPSVFVSGYAPYSELFSRAAVTVHPGGIGTTAQALRAGRPMLIVPYCHDQPDNASRVARLGAGRILDRSNYDAPSAARELSLPLEDSCYTSRAAEAARRIQAEDGVAAACDAIERIAAGSGTMFKKCENT